MSKQVRKKDLSYTTEVEVGIDIQNLKKFTETIDRSEEIKHKLFTLNELGNGGMAHLCGIFCAKEALIKAGVIGVGEWQKVEILNTENGKPYVKLQSTDKVDNIKVSISHTDTICIAIAIKL